MSAESYILVGTAVSRSPSPAMMNAAFKAVGVPASYRAESIEAGGLAEFFSGCKRAGIAGVSVTMPFKTEIMPLLDVLDERAKEVGAVNTVKRVEKSYSGFNTDIDGILKPLHVLAKERKLMRGAVIGAGGAARAFVGAMHRLGCREVSVVARNRPHASRVLGELGQRFPDMTLRVFRIERGDIEKLGEIDILFNAAPIGGNGARVPKELFALLKGGPVVFDAVYDPVETELVREARRWRCPTIPGHEMLLWQGLAAFEIWTGTKGPEETMREALIDALRGRAR